MSQLTNEQLERYSRHIILEQVGGKGQKKILSAKVLIIGTGGLGAPAAMYLAAAGVGHIGLVDFDTVDLSNLQRQIIHLTNDVGKAKTQSGRETINAMNPDVQVHAYDEQVTAANIRDIIGDLDYDFIIDGTDNFPAKFLINDACVLMRKPFSPKIESGRETINALNPDVQVHTYDEQVTSANICDIIRDLDYDFIIDGTDNFPAKFLIC